MIWLLAFVVLAPFVLVACAPLVTAIRTLRLQRLEARLDLLEQDAEAGARQTRVLLAHRRPY